MLVLFDGGMEGAMRMRQSSRQESVVLELGPVPTAAAAGRGFVREMCGRWSSRAWPTRPRWWPTSW